MVGSYGSYSSMSSSASPIDITPSSYLYSSPATFASCAYPSWPQGESLAQSPQETRATSYLSDDDLFPCDGVDFDASSTASSSSFGSNASDDLPYVPEEQLLAMRREQQRIMQREAVKYIMDEKERRKAASKKARRSGSSSKKSPKNKLQGMTPISEACE